MIPKVRVQMAVKKEDKKEDERIVKRADLATNPFTY
jgi:hypothetical protein